LGDAQFLGGGFLGDLFGLILAGTVIALTVATPVLVIFSPMLVPAAITLALMAAGFILLHCQAECYLVLYLNCYFRCILY
jgi:hypothetical protein